MDLAAIKRAAGEIAPYVVKSANDQYNVVRAASSCILKPQTFKRGVALLTQLVLTDELPHKAKQLVYAAMEVSGNLIMKGANSGHMEVDEKEWRSMLEVALEAGKFTEYQNRNFQDWLKHNFTTIKNSKKSSDAVWSEGAPIRLRLAEAILAKRTNRFSLVLEGLYDDFNQQAIIRTADSFGVQNVHVVAGGPIKYSKNRVSASITKNLMPYMSIHQYETTKECIEALKASGHQIWATDLSPEAVKLDDSANDLIVPEKLAVVFGKEISGCSEEILAAADKRVFIPLYGFAESLNVTVAAALMLQTLFSKCPEARGNLNDAEKASLRQIWYKQLARSSPRKHELFQSFLVNPPPPLDDIRRLDKSSSSYCGHSFRSKSSQSSDSEFSDSELSSGYSSSGSASSLSSKGSPGDQIPKKSKSHTKTKKEKEGKMTESQILENDGPTKKPKLSEDQGL